MRGGEVDFTRYEGKPLVVCFFSLDDASSLEQVKRLRPIRQRFAESRVGIFAACVSASKREDVASFTRGIDAARRAA